MQDKIEKFAKKVNIEFNNIDLLRQAFVHKSFLNEHQNFKLGHNERFEFLGDAVLELVITDFLFKKFPKKPEGDLTNIRASLVNSNNLAETAARLEISKYLFLSHGESKDKNSKARKFIMADSIEAIIGAIYLDQGYESANKFIIKNLIHSLDEIIENELYMDPKTKFQEKSQEIFNITPKYNLLKEVGPDHNKIFTVGLFIDEELVAQADGTSKQEAEINAAKLGLKKKSW